MKEYKEIREKILESDDNYEQVRISRDGYVYIKTNEERGDGGQTPWWKLGGTINYYRELINLGAL